MISHWACEHKEAPGLYLCSVTEINNALMALAVDATYTNHHGSSAFLSKGITNLSAAPWE